MVQHKTGVPQGLVLGPLFFLVYINDLLGDFSSDSKLFADDTSIFTSVYDENIVAEQLSNDLKFIYEWAYQWKMQFNPDKQYRLFSRKGGLNQLSLSNYPDMAWPSFHCNNHTY